MRRIAYLIIVVLTLSCSKDFDINEPYQASTGQYEVTTVTSGGPDNNYYLYYPSDMSNGSHPIAVFCVGTNMSPSDYSKLLIQVASHGVVVIAGNNSNQANGIQAIDGLNWLIAQNVDSISVFYQKLKTDKVLAFGHSQGGNAAMHVAIEQEDVTAALVLMLGDGTAGNAEKAEASLIEVPIIYLTANMDLIVPSSQVLERYNDTDNALALYGVHKGTGHMVINEDIKYYIRAWIYAQLYDNSVAQKEFYGSEYGFADDLNWKDVQRNF